MNQELMTLDFWQDKVTYGGRTIPIGTIGCAALNITDKQITIAYIHAAQVIGAVAAVDEKYSRGVGVVKLIQEMAQLGNTLMIYKQTMTALAHALHASQRTPDGYAAAFAEHFSKPDELSSDNTL